ncbi:hypothetical protein [Actinacidiphila bryophytorum]|uniref:Uncharacterized protein n=1 Tax=Actinacidiphila bryophytorum TaxID=1436133 RepID=A0A9W4H8X6_9ACTN|nr:hypothetical protein [Actinacidiphila bryophytorum]MBM9440274.1 hypothetical protein [Actinacidiphila bryophytorum]MBN6545681.1 hypothetical protein [Actinacidiphila bryophytorum]CAG7658528.1 conserved hypothetical protein [Actinacidiphila bryophytorum]
MDSVPLEAAYAFRTAAAEAVGDAWEKLDPDDRAAADTALTRTLLADRALAAAARDVLAGHAAVVDCRAAVDEAAVAALCASTSYQERIARLRTDAGWLVETVTSTPDSLAATPVALHLLDSTGRPLPERHLPWREAVRVMVTDHIPRSTSRLAALSGAVRV